VEAVALACGNLSGALDQPLLCCRIEGGMLNGPKESGRVGQPVNLIHERIQELAAKFLRNGTGNFFEGIRENFRGNREFSRQNSKSDPGPIF
jgi:hypothetical protein